MSKDFADLCVGLKVMGVTYDRGMYYMDPNVIYIGLWGSRYDSHDILAEDVEDPATYVDIEGWSAYIAEYKPEYGTINARKELHQHLRLCGNTQMKTETGFWFRLHLGWAADMERVPYWSYGLGIGESTGEPEGSTNEFWCGDRSNTGYPYGYATDGALTYEYPEAQDWLQHTRSRNHFNQIFGMEPEEYMVKYPQEKPKYIGDGVEFPTVFVDAGGRVNVV